MANLSSWYDTGTASVANGSTSVTGTGTLWGDDAIMPGDLFVDLAQPMVPPQRIKSVEGNGALTLAAPWPGTELTDAAYEIRYVGIIERSTAQTRRVLEQLGEVSAYYDVQVDTIADRDDFDARPAGYRVLVSDIGDGRAAIYSKASSADADWTDPAYFSGPVGPTPDVTVGTVTTGDPGTPAQVTPTPTEGGVELDFTIPAGEGFAFIGAYDDEATYAKGAVVRDSGSAWIALQATTGNAPPVYPTVSNTWWELLAVKGQDGTGTGDVVGPASSVDERIAVFDGTTGKLLKDGGKTLAEVVPANNSITNAILADMAAGTFKGRGAGTGDPQDLSIVGTVSQSSGIPTGAIIERGSNANGEYVKFADGTMICTSPAIPQAVEESAGSLYRSSSNAAWTFPATFANTPSVSGSSSQVTTWVNVQVNGPTSCSMRQYGAGTAPERDNRLVAIGRWF